MLMHMLMLVCTVLTGVLIDGYVNFVAELAWPVVSGWLVLWIMLDHLLNDAITFVKQSFTCSAASTWQSCNIQVSAFRFKLFSNPAALWV